MWALFVFFLKFVPHFFVHLCHVLRFFACRVCLQDAIREAGGHVALVEALKKFQGASSRAGQACDALSKLARGNVINQVTSTGRTRGWCDDRSCHVVCRCVRRVMRCVPRKQRPHVVLAELDKD